jgi:hypothetical protein
MRLRILTFNVWNEEGDPRRFSHINGELRRLDPDLVAFQEVASRDGWTCCSKARPCMVCIRPRR